MGDNKNIDRLFQEKFKDFEVLPEAGVWKGIEQKLVKRKKRRIIPLWLQIAGAAAILLLIIAIGNQFYNTNTKKEIPNSNIITDVDNSDSDNLDSNQNKNDIKKVPSSATGKESLNSPDNSEQIQESLVTKAQGSKKSKTTTNQKPFQQAIAHQDDVNAQNLKEDENVISSHQKIDKTFNNKNIDELQELEQSEKEKEVNVAIIEKEEEKSDLMEEVNQQKTFEIASKNEDKKWSIGSVIGPVYMSSFSEGSPIDPALANNSKSSNGTISYGLKVNYKLSDKFSLQSGIHNVDLGYSTENVSVITTSSLLNQSNTNINSNIEGAAVQVLSTVSQQSEVFSQRSPFDTSGNLDQNLSYVEVPLEAKYALVQKKLGVNLVGGVSTYFLYDNDVSVTSFGKKTSLGEASNVNDLNFSGNLGLDVNYNINKNLYINASPMLKYQLNTFSENSGGFKPYFFGVYAGLNFRF